MMKICARIGMCVFLFITSGCMPYQDEIEKAREAKENAERMYEEAKKEAEEAKGALQAEQTAVNRIYDEE